MTLLIMTDNIVYIVFRRTRIYMKVRLTEYIQLRSTYIYSAIPRMDIK